MKSSTPLVLSRFTIDRDAHSEKHGIAFPDESLTDQSQKDQSDINTIVKNFGLTHELPYGIDVPKYDDFTNAPTDYHAALNFIREADSVFMEVPANIRSRFENDAGNFLQFLSDDTNREEAANLGLIPPLPNPPPSDGGGDSSPPSDGGGDKP